MARKKGQQLKEGVKVSANKAQEQAAYASAYALNPSHTAAAVTQTYSEEVFGTLDFATLGNLLTHECGKVSGGDLGHMESMLLTQAHALQAIFTALSRRAQGQEYLNQLETHLRLALRAQNQCRATLETLAAIKNPTPVAFVRQANIANGPQQINNCTTNASPTARVQKHQNAPNELLEINHEQGEWLDLGTSNAAGGTDSELEAVGNINRPTHRSRKSDSLTQC